MAHTQQQNIPLMPMRTAMSISQPDSTVSHTIRRKPLLNSSQSNRAQEWLPGRPDTRYVPLTRELFEEEHIAVALPRETHHSTAPHATKPQQSWLPYSLRKPTLAALVAIAAVLLIVVASLHYRSVSDLGLADDTGSASIYFAWRFAPTLTAVAYVTFIMIVLEDIKRTEPFARLSKSAPPSGEASILRSSGPWWNVLIDSLPRRLNNHTFSPTAFSAVVAYILGFAILSPFSSALLSPVQITRARIADFKNFRLSQDTAVQLDFDPLMFYQTFGHFLQNVTTSAWISDTYAVMPSWPSSYSDPPLGALLSTSEERWQVDAQVFQSQLSCEKLVLQASVFSTMSFVDQNTGATLYSMQFSSGSDCQYGFAVLNSSLVYDPQYVSNDLIYGGSFWSTLDEINLDAITTANYYYRGYLGSAASPMLLNYSSGCEPGEVIMVMAKTPTEDAMDMGGYICQQAYYQATVSVNISHNSTVSTFAIDEANFRQIRQPLADALVNVSGFQTSFLGTAWDQYMVAALDTRPRTGGPANLLSALSNFDMATMLTDPELPLNAARIKQHFFGQALQALLQQNSTTAYGNIKGQILHTAGRIVVVQTVAYTIESVLALQILLYVVVFFYSGRRLRPLGLSQDPAFVNTLITLFSEDSRTCQFFDSLNEVTDAAKEGHLAKQQFSLTDGGIHVTDRSHFYPTERQMQQSRLSQPHTLARKPVVITTWATLLLLISLVIILVAIITLSYLSSENRLYQAAFVYEADVSIDGDTLGRLAPYSIIPTLIAVLIGLWWGAFESVCRVAQPYIAMAKRAVPSSRGSGLSYQSSYLAWAAFRAFSRGHWLLALVCVGATLAQAFTIAMSALWQKEMHSVISISVASQTLQLRQIPHLNQGQVAMQGYAADPIVGDVFGSVFDNVLSSWIYGAAIQLTLNGSEPAWSQAGWSFVPVDMSTSAKGPTNITIIRPAIRARLECSSMGNVDNSSWLTEFTNLSNSSFWNTTINPTNWDTGFELGCDRQITDPSYYYEYGQQLNVVSGNGKPCNASVYTTVIASNAINTCCAQGSSANPGVASIGYWSKNIPSDGGSGDYYRNFTVKWIYGRAVEGYYMASSIIPHLIWPEAPTMTALNCQPIIETANASVTVDSSTGNVQTHSILDEPTPYELAWTDYLLRRNFSADNPCYYSASGTCNVRNITTSFGPLFMGSLLGASSITTLTPCVGGTCGMEDLGDRTFNIRREGLNVDYMSYAMFTMANNTPQALSDVDTLTRLAQKTFSTFFQHFASNNVSIDGGWVYQRVNATLPSDLGGPATNYYGNEVIVQAPSASSEHTNATIEVTVSRNVEMLRMSPIATWLCIVILVWLIATTVLVVVFEKRYFAPLLRPVNTIADIAMLIVSSERYLALARERGATGLREDKNFRTRLGWFRTRSGQVRWGIELADQDVDFLTEEEVHMLGDGTGNKGNRASKFTGIFEGKATASNGPEAKPMASTSQREVSNAWTD